MKTRTAPVWLCLAAVAVLTSGGCDITFDSHGNGSAMAIATARAATAADEAATAPATAAAPPEATGTSADAPIAPYQVELLEIAFDAASALPLHPHVKNRARAQEGVVTACLDLDQPRRALAYTEQIPNWRKGVGYADLAFHLAERGETENVSTYLYWAQEIAMDAEDWRRDRILVKIARTHALLGRTELAEELEAGVVPSETGKVDAVRARSIDADDFEDRMEAVDAVVAAGDMDVVRNALESCAELYERFYDDAYRRDRAEEKVRASLKQLPLTVQVDLLLKLARLAQEHEDLERSLALVDEAQAIVDGYRWDLEFHLPLLADLAAARFRAGDAERARRHADAALALFEARKDEIVDMFRAKALRPLAEAYRTMGDTDAARSVYASAIEEGHANPYGRPRAMDLAATLCSMAVHGVDPGEAMWKRIRAVRAELGAPW